MAIYHHFGPPNMCPQYGFEIQMSHGYKANEEHDRIYNNRIQNDTHRIFSVICAYLHTPNIHYTILYDTVLEVGSCTNFMRYKIAKPPGQIVHRILYLMCSFYQSFVNACHHSHYPHFYMAKYIHIVCCEKHIPIANTTHAIHTFMLVL